MSRTIFPAGAHVISFVKFGMAEKKETALSRCSWPGKRHSLQRSIRSARQLRPRLKRRRRSRAARLHGAAPPESAQFLSAPIRADWSRGELLYKGRFGLQRDLFGLLKCSDRARVCARPECPAPYFFLDLKRRKSARYCGPDCSEARDRESKKKSWHRHPEWKKPRRKGGKR